MIVTLVLMNLQPAQAHRYWEDHSNTTHPLRSLQTCSSTQYRGADTSCKDCIPPCDGCTSPAACTSCKSPYMVKEGSLCKFCPVKKFYDIHNKRCDDCVSTCSSYCVEKNICLQCTDMQGPNTPIALDTAQYFSIDSFHCKSTCSENSFTIGGVKYCRSQIIYVDPDSTKPFEMGNKDYPYKTIDSAVVEIYNFWTKKNQTGLTIILKVKENTINKIHFRTHPLILYNIYHIIIESYTEVPLKAVPDNAIIMTTDKGSRSLHWSTLFTPIQDLAYKHATLLTYLTYEQRLQLIRSQWYAIVIVDTHVEFKSITFKTDIQTQDDSQSIIYSHQSKEITLRNCEFNGFGTYFFTETSLQFHAYTTKIVTDNMVGGFVFEIACNPLVDKVIGEILIDKLTLTGARNHDMKYGAVYYAGPENFTLSNSNLGSHGTSKDGKYLIQIDTLQNCLPVDSTLQSITIDSNTITCPLTGVSGTPIHGFNINLYNTYTRKNLKIVFRNNVIQNVQKTKQFILFLGGENAVIEASGTLFKNCTSSTPLFWLDSHKDVIVTNTTFEKSSAIGFNPIFIIKDTPNLLISGFNFQNLFPGIYPESVIMLQTGFRSQIKLDKINFHDVNLDHTQAIISLTEADIFYFTNSLIKSIKFRSQTSMFEMLKCRKIEWANLTFENISYTDAGGDNGPILNIRSIEWNDSQGDSQINDLTLTNVNTQTILIQDMHDSGSTKPHHLILNRLRHISSTITHTYEVFIIEGYRYTGVSTIIINDGYFYNLTFSQLGSNLFSFHYISTTPIKIMNSKFEFIHGGGVLLSPYDTSDANIKLNLRIQNCSFLNNDPKKRGFITTTQNSALTITNSTFIRTHSLGKGSVFFTDHSKVLISDTNFTENYAIEGGIAYFQYKSYIECTNCVFQKNFGILGGLMFQAQQARFKMTNCEIKNNFAFSATLAFMTESKLYFSEMGNSRIVDNYLFDYNDFIAGKRLGLDFLDTGFVNYIVANKVKYEGLINGVKYFVQSLGAKFRILNNSTVQNQYNFYIGFDSIFTISDSKFQTLNVIARDPVFELIDTQMMVLNTQFINITILTDPSVKYILYFIDSKFHSTVSLVNTNYSNVVTSLVQCEDSTLNINNSDFYDITSQNYMFTTKDSQINLNEFKLIRAHIRLKVFYIQGGKSSFTDLHLSEGDSTYLQLEQAEVTLHHSDFHAKFNNTRAIESYSTTLTITKSTFHGFKSTSSNGGAIYAKDYNLYISQDSRFMRNSALKGGAVYFDCGEEATCASSISSSTFMGNTATIEGGAWAFNYFEPNTSNVTYINNQIVQNTVRYGPNYAGYPYSLRLVSTQVLNTSFVSGQEIPMPIEIEILDSFNQRIETDNNHIISIIAQNQTQAKVIGESEIVLNKGLASINNIKLISVPGSAKVVFLASSSGISQTKLLNAYQTSCLLSGITLQVLINFRKCVRGEQLKNDQCIVCESGSYSLGGDTCHVCPKSAQCPGGARLNVIGGFWRANINQSSIHECLYAQACLEVTNSDKDIPYKCKPGYSSILCTKCVSNKDTHFQSAAQNQCGRCPNPTMNFFRIFALQVVFCLFFFLMVAINLRRTHVSKKAILWRLLANYLQILSYIAHYSLTFPNTITQFLRLVRTVGDTLELILSWDCLMKDLKLIKYNEPVVYFRLIGLAITVGVLGVAFLIFWTLVTCCRSSSVLTVNYRQIWNRSILTWVSATFLMYPSIVDHTFDLFRCYSVDGVDYLYKDMNIICWSTSHINNLTTIGLPVMVLIVIGFPLVCLYQLYKHRHNLDNPVLFLKYKIFYQGIRDQCFYWEFCVLGFKIFIIVINVFLGTFKTIYRVFAGVILFIILIQSQVYLQPYKEPIFNKLEQRMYIVGLTIMFSGFFFTFNPSEFVKNVIIVWIICANIYCLSLWLHLMLRKQSNFFLKNISLMLARLNCISYGQPVYLNENPNTDGKVNESDLQFMESQDKLSKVVRTFNDAGRERDELDLVKSMKVMKTMQGLEERQDGQVDKYGEKRHWKGYKGDPSNLDASESVRLRGKDQFSHSQKDSVRYDGSMWIIDEKKQPELEGGGEGPATTTAPTKSQSKFKPRQSRLGLLIHNNIGKIKVQAQQKEDPHFNQKPRKSRFKNIDGERKESKVKFVPGSNKAPSQAQDQSQSQKKEEKEEYMEQKLFKFAQTGFKSFSTRIMEASKEKTGKGGSVTKKLEKPKREKVEAQKQLMKQKYDRKQEEVKGEHTGRFRKADLDESARELMEEQSGIFDNDLSRVEDIMIENVNDDIVNDSICQELLNSGKSK